MEKIRNYINGEWVEPKVEKYFDVINPATGQVIAKTPLGTKADVDAEPSSKDMKVDHSFVSLFWWMYLNEAKSRGLKSLVPC